jgi:hypothetical protein
MAGKKTFVAGEVLLAQDVNDFLMDQSVMNFATSAARASAIPTPTEGMTTYVQDTNQLETFDGTEYRGMSGLQLVKKQDIGTGVTSVVVNDAFSATYDSYKIIVSGGVASGPTDLILRLGASTTGYYACVLFTLYGAGPVDSVKTFNGTGFPFMGYANTSAINANFELNNPFLSKNTAFSAFAPQMSTANAPLFNGGYHAGADSFTGFTLIVNTGNLTGGTVRVYGYGK